METSHQKPVDIHVQELGCINYKLGWDLQQEHFDQSVQRKLDRKQDTNLSPPENHLLFCAHNHVYTLGKSGSVDHLLLNRAEMAERAIEFYRNNRGGDITYHGPGQVIGYPILDLEQFNPDIKDYMHKLEEVIIRTLADYNIEGQRIEGSIGIWLDKETPHKTRKICAFGVKTSRWITMHGWALNVDVDLQYFNFIIPCGISDKQVTSMDAELGYRPDHREVRERIQFHFSDVFHANLKYDEVA